MEPPVSNAAQVIPANSVPPQDERDKVEDEAQQQARKELDQMREVLGIKALERRLEHAEAAKLGAYVEQTPAEPPNPMQAAVAMLLPRLPELLEAVIGKLLGSEKAAPESVLWKTIEEKYDQRKRAEMQALADKILSGTGLVIEDEKPEPGVPDGGSKK